MSDPFLGEIRMFGGNFAPDGWAICDGSLVSIGDYPTLFQLIGNTFGGDGVNTFGLPDLRGRMPIHQGQGNGLSPRQMGQTGGMEQVTLTADALAQHNHSPLASTATGSTDSPVNAYWAASNTSPQFAPASSTNAALNVLSVGSTGGPTLPHENMMPFLAINFIIATGGTFPTPG